MEYGQFIQHEGLEMQLRFKCSCQNQILLKMTINAKVITTKLVPVFTKEFYCFISMSVF